MRAMPNVVARKGRIIAAWISDAVVDGVMPVVVVIGRDSVPATVMGFHSVVRPTLPSICTANGNSLASKPQCPHIWRVRVSNAGLNRLRSLSRRQRLNDRIRLRKNIFNSWIAFYSGDVWTCCQCLGRLATASHKYRVNYDKGLMRDPGFTQSL